MPTSLAIFKNGYLCMYVFRFYLKGKVMQRETVGEAERSVICLFRTMSKLALL